MLSITAQNFNDTLSYIRRYYKGTPVAGIVLGTGMGQLVKTIDVEQELAYNFIPHFAISTVESHFGKLLFGQMAGVPVVAMQGRLHYYEGYSMSQITYPIRILRKLGIQQLYVSNAAGGINPAFKRGDLMVIDDHINLLPENPLRGQNLDELGPRFPDMSQPYDRGLIQLARQVAREENLALQQGVYVAVQGPNLETRAEYRYLRAQGGDAVGMSTVPEVIVAAHMGLRTFALSVITDECDPDTLQPVTVEEIVQVAARTEPLATRIFQRLIPLAAASAG
jgi:purine-nucleoside phosphorylase